jgi:hypothetical protein
VDTVQLPAPRLAGRRCGGRSYHDATAVSLVDSAQDRYFSRRAVAFIRDIGRVKNVTSAATGCSRAVFRETMPSRET